MLLESEELPLAQQPVVRPVGEPAAANGGGADEGPTRIDLDAVVEGLEPGRWVIVSGERVDIPGTTGVISSELAMVSTIELHPDSGAGGSAYSTLVLAPEGMKYRYKRSTAKVYANVVKATHGDTRAEILGAGDGAKALQTFTLHQMPLTFVSAPTVDGVQSTLAIRVNDILWHETDTFFGTGAQDRVFVDEDRGRRQGLGDLRQRPRRLASADRSRQRARALSQRHRQAGQRARESDRHRDLASPRRERRDQSARRERRRRSRRSRDDARRSIPVSLQAMGRIVSVRDYADFARTFGGISKAIAVEITDGRRQIVHLTIGGTGDIEIDSTPISTAISSKRCAGSAIRTSRSSCSRARSSSSPAARKCASIPTISGRRVGPKVRAKLLDVFSYDRRDFGQVVFPSEAVAAIQGRRGRDVRRSRPLRLDRAGRRHRPHRRKERRRIRTPDIEGVNAIVPKHGQIAYLPPELADLFILTEIEDEE